MGYELDRRKIRLYKITALYLVGFIAALSAMMAMIYITASFFGPGVLFIYAAILMLIYPSYQLAKKKLRELEEREYSVERELRRDW